MSDALTCYQNGGDLLSCVLNDLVGAVGGEATFGVVVGSVLLVSFYIAGNGDLFPPAVLVTIAGGMLFPLLPSSFRTIGVTLVILGLAAAILSAGEKFVRGGPA